MTSHYRTQLEQYLKTLDVKAERVLDVGGAQLPAKGRTRTWDARTYHIMDLDCPHDGAAKPDMVCDLNTGNADSGEWVEPKPYDLVFCLEAMDYVWNPMNAMRLIWNRTAKGGRLIISFPFLYPIHQPVNDDALRYTPQAAVKLLEHARFTIDRVVERTMTETGERLWDSFLRTEHMHPAKHFNHNILGVIIEATKPAG